MSISGIFGQFQTVTRNYFSKSRENLFQLKREKLLFFFTKHGSKSIVNGLKDALRGFFTFTFAVVDFNVTFEQSCW